MTYTPEHIASIIAQNARHKLARSLLTSADWASRHADDEVAFEMTLNSIVEAIALCRERVAKARALASQEGGE